MTMPNETSKSAKQTLVEEGTEFKGTMKSSCPVVVNGTIDGEVDAPEITITRSGAVLGAIKAKKVRSLGTLSGNVDAGDVFLSGSVRSNTVIKANTVVGALSCTGNAPGPTNGGQPNTAGTKAGQCASL